MGFSLKGILKTVKNVGLPILGNALLPGVGGALGGALAGSIGNGKPKLGSIAKGAVGGALSGGVGAGALKTVGAGGVKGLLGQAGGFLKDNPDLILGGLSAIQGAKAQGKADKLGAQALAHETGRYNELAPLRTMGREGMMSKARPDLSGIYGGSSNPFSRPLRPMNTVAPGPQAENPLERPLREITMPGGY